MSSEVIAAYDDFSGGHWGNLGPTKAGPTQWGGKNVTVDEHGWLAPFSAAVPMTFSNQVQGRIISLFWAYGTADVAFMLTARNGSSSQTDLYRFSTSPYLATRTFSTTTTIAAQSTYMKDWTLSAEDLYLTFTSNTTTVGKTYHINVTTNQSEILTGTYGDAPGGICIAQYGERLVVGNLADDRYGSVPQRIAWSGDDTNNDPTVRTAWEALNYLDLGPPGNEGIDGLYPTRDALYVVMHDGTIWQITGTLGTNEVVRRLTGYSKGTQSADTFNTQNAAVDPSNTRLWMFNYARWGIDRFNGASLSGLPGIGTVHYDRSQNTSTRTYGDVVTHGGVDEVVALGVGLGTQSGVTISSTAQPLALVRNAGINSIVNIADVAPSWGDPVANQYPRMIGNDRHALILATARGGTAANSCPAFAYWFGDAPSWDTALIGEDDGPYFASRVSSTTAVPFVIHFPYRKPQKNNMEWEIDGVRVDYVPRPQALSTAASAQTGSVFDLGSTTSTYAVTLSATVIGDGIPSFARGAAVGTSGAYSSSTHTWTSTYGEGASDIWPNLRTAFFPCRMARVRGARVVLSGNDVRIVNVQLLGKQVPGRTT